MGTNYYIKPKHTECDHQDHWIHLGKSSAGQRFTFQAYPRGWLGPEDEVPTWPIIDFPSWLRLFDLGEVYDEYGHRVNKPYMREMIQRKHLQPWAETGHDYVDEAGHHFIRGDFS